MKLSHILAGVLLAAVGGQSMAATVTGAGATFPQPVYSKWASEYQRATGNQVNYQGIGSSGGIKQIQAKTVDFGATDAPMTPAQLNASNLIQFPAVIGGVVPVVNIAGVAPGQLKLTGPILADIYLGKITQWDDARIKAINPGVNLPAAKITTVNRSDGSGTTHVFTTYLSQVSSDWKSSVGADKTVKWPNANSSVGGKGNEGVSSNVQRVANSIGYVEYAYAKQNRLAHTQLQNRAGRFIQPDDSTFAAAGNINWARYPGFAVSITNMPAANAWPISTATYILVPRTGGGAKTQEAIKFFDWAFNNGDNLARSLDYVPLPEATKIAVRNEWRKIR
ncbi:phosphate ABC transporter substrate-binding protein PstS [Moraxella atlantae]|uniref:Phosphate-binding protein PstS n=1 Tax=Faucicola atlantae TaxID=34059 RepID=A0A378Q5W6_9GAMM|nr:phosphate ABC transporter substrate-binding protein PstS [Moraxella atlantae]OPH34861.1 phosphate ABC transporter substrate-binding protein PstS [Moraxella atlantae]STY96223.1 Phosphate-binding protein pstS precursor [Moraxella atlantae]